MPVLKSSSADHVPTVRRAAQYLRMSTDYQRYSIENQKEVISEYASSHGIKVVQTYADIGRSGLKLRGRDALLLLISDIREGRADFDLVLVYDVSRWGRFQDIDESAHYEFLCRKAGVSVEYCAEEFRNDGGMVATLLKGMKRAMAGEFSRELSIKVFAGHKRLASLGFHQGGTAGFGLRRMLVDRQRRPKGLLAHGQQKNLQRDRVLLAPGPPHEVQIVRDIFRLYVVERLSHKGIARVLNQQGILTERGKRWSGHSVHNLLANERYIGNFIYNRTSLKLQSRRIRNPHQNWIRAESVMEPLIEPELFAAAQRLLKVTWELSDTDLLNHLTAVWCAKGYLSCTAMKQVRNTPVANTYRERFGSLDNAYRLIGYKPTHHYRSAQVGDLLRKIDREVICALTSSVERHGRAIHFDSKSGLLRMDGKTTVLTVVAPFTACKSGRAGWWFYFDRWPKSDFIFLVRMTPSNSEVLDYHLGSFPLFVGPSFRFTDENLSALTNYRLVSPAVCGDFLCSRGDLPCS